MDDLRRREEEGRKDAQYGDLGRLNDGDHGF